MAGRMNFAPTVRGARGKRKAKKGHLNTPRIGKKAKRQARQQQRNQRARELLEGPGQASQ